MSCTHDNQNEAGLCPACLGVNPITRLIEEQNTEFVDRFSFVAHAGVFKVGEGMIQEPCDADDIYDWHTTSIIQLLEAIIREMEKQKVRRMDFSEEEAETTSDEAAMTYFVKNSVLARQINNLTAVIAELKQL